MCWNIFSPWSILIPLLSKINYFPPKKIHFPPFEEEVELFNSYKTQIDTYFESMKQTNLLISLQEEELFKAKKQILEKFHEFNMAKEIILKEIAIERAELRALRKEKEQLKRNIMYLEKVAEIKK